MVVPVEAAYVGRGPVNVGRELSLGDASADGSLVGQDEVVDCERNEAHGRDGGGIEMADDAKS